MKSVTDLPSSTSNINSLQIKTNFLSATINKLHTIWSVNTLQTIDDSRSRFSINH